jgi:hypothetical protein
MERSPGASDDRDRHSGCGQTLLNFSPISARGIFNAEESRYIEPFFKSRAFRKFAAAGGVGAKISQFKAVETFVPPRDHFPAAIVKPQLSTPQVCAK